MLLADQVVGVAAMPLNVTVLVPGSPEIAAAEVTGRRHGTARWREARQRRRGRRWRIVDNLG